MKIVTFILITSLLAAPVSALAYSSGIETEVQEYKILEGNDQGQLNLDDKITRAEMTKILCSTMQLNLSENSSDFTDISSHWAKDYINSAAQNHLVNGFEDGSFHPDDYVTYEQAIKMILGENIYASYPNGYVAFSIEHNFLDNVNSLMNESITRGDAAQIIVNIIKTISSEDNLNDFHSFSGLQRLINLYTKTSDKLEDGDSVNSSSAVPSYGGNSSGGISSAGGSSHTSSAEKSLYYSYFNPYYSSESYSQEDENIFKSVLTSPLSTFSIDTDTTSYSNMRRFAVNGQRIPDGAIRTEELINYFDYNLPQPTDGTPFSVTTEIGICPWNNEHNLAMINIQGEELTERQPQNLVFLLDVSGSMYSYNKLPLVKRSMELLLDKLDERDTISIVTYASGTNVIASGIHADKKSEIMNIINSLSAGGGTNGSGGLQLAYQQAEEFKCSGNNRIILCTDGDFNIGIEDNNELKNLISEKRSNNIYLSVLGFGLGNYKDDKLEIIADNGDGGYYYIDNLREAKKVLSDEMTSTLYTIAKDVKIQVEFNPTQVSSYRLIGYENRRLENEQFNNDKADAGELGAGASVTALYEIVPSSSDDVNTENTELRYQTPQYRGSSELMDIKLRYKLPSGGDSILKEYPVANNVTAVTSDNFRFASAAAEIGMLANKSEYTGTASYDSAIELARSALGDDPLGIRHEFIQIADLTRFLNR